ncbi:MAG: hypothetical protein KF731_05345 [Thauera sp.]|nr:hypothetical protein [Thauera sp.]
MGIGVAAFLYVPILCLIVLSHRQRSPPGSTASRCAGTPALARDAELHAGGALSLRVGARRHRRRWSAPRSAVIPARRPYPGSRFFVGMMSAPMVMPEVVVGLSLVLLTHSIRRSRRAGGRGGGGDLRRTTTLCAAYGGAGGVAPARDGTGALEEAALDPRLSAAEGRFFAITACRWIALCAGGAIRFASTPSMDDFVLAAMLRTRAARRCRCWCSRACTTDSSPRSTRSPR